MKRYLRLISTKSIDWSIFCFALRLSAERSKKINKTNNTSFHACSENGPLS